MLPIVIGARLGNAAAAMARAVASDSVPSVALLASSTSDDVCAGVSEATLGGVNALAHFVSATAGGAGATPPPTLGIG